MLDRLDRLWRGFGTGLFLAVIGIGGSLLALTVFPLIVLVVRAPLARQRRIQAVIRASFKLYCAPSRPFGSPISRLSAASDWTDCGEPWWSPTIRRCWTWF